MGSPKERPDEPVLITEAQPSLDEQFRSRKKKYAILMGTRTVCLILAAVFYRTPWLMLILAGGSLVLPWMAVLIANDAPPKKTRTVHRYSAGSADRAIEPPVDRSRVIDG